MPYRVLMVEDDGALALVLTDMLEAADFAVEHTADGAAAAARAEAERFDLLLLDVGLPGCDGMEVCRRLREHGVHTPVMMLTAFDSTAAKVAGLDAGADDYVTKPFEPVELLARMRALLRREQKQQLAQLLEFRFGGVYVDFWRGVARKCGMTVSLSAKELQLLRYFVHRAGMVLPRSELLREVWGYQATATRTLDMHVATLRQKLEDDPQSPRHFVTVRGEGYQFQP